MTFTTSSRLWNWSVIVAFSQLSNRHPCGKSAPSIPTPGSIWRSCDLSKPFDDTPVYAKGKGRKLVVYCFPSLLWNSATVFFRYNKLISVPRHGGVCTTEWSCELSWQGHASFFLCFSFCPRIDFRQPPKKKVRFWFAALLIEEDST